MRKLSIMISMGIALFISASGLSGCGDSEKTEIVEKKTVFYKIKLDHEAVVSPPVMESPAPSSSRLSSSRASRSASASYTPISTGDCATSKAAA